MFHCRGLLNLSVRQISAVEFRFYPTLVEQVG